MPIPQSNPELGAGLSLATAFFWAISPLAFASAGRRIGSYPVVVLRTALATVLLLILLGIHAAIQPVALPTWPQVLWLIASGFSGMVIGDALYYEAMVRLGPRRAAQAQVLAPVAAVTLGWAAMGETLDPRALGGIALVLAATSYAVLGRARAGTGGGTEPGRITPMGVLIGVAAALCVGIGAVFGRRAYVEGPLDPILATTLRVGISAVMLAAVPVARGQATQIASHLRDRHLASRIVAGTLAGPFIGMLCYLAALQQMKAGLVSTLVALSPVFILPMIAARYKARIGWDIALAALLAGAGVALISWR